MSRFEPPSWLRPQARYSVTHNYSNLNRGGDALLCIQRRLEPWLICWNNSTKIPFTSTWLTSWTKSPQIRSQQQKCWGNTPRAIMFVNMAEMKAAQRWVYHGCVYVNLTSHIGHTGHSTTSVWGTICLPSFSYKLLSFLFGSFSELFCNHFLHVWVYINGTFKHSISVYI